MHSAHTGLVVPSSTRIKAKQGRRRRQQETLLRDLCVASCLHVPALWVCPGFLWWWGAMWNCEPQKPFLPQILSVMMFYHSHRYLNWGRLESPNTPQLWAMCTFSPTLLPYITDQVNLSAGWPYRNSRGSEVLYFCLLVNVGTLGPKLQSQAKRERKMAFGWVTLSLWIVFLSVWLYRFSIDDLPVLVLILLFSWLMASLLGVILLLVDLGFSFYGCQSLLLV